MFAFVIFMIYVISVSSHFISTPRNQVVIRGERLQLEWKMKISLSYWKWSFTQPPGIKKPTNIVNRNLRFSSNFSHFRFNESDSSMAIYAEAVKLEDAGNYTFEYLIGDKSSAFAVQNIVLESLPRCHNESMGSDIKLTCTVNFRGFWAPKIKWEIIHDNEIAEDYPEEEEVSSRQLFPNSNVASSVILRAANTSKKDVRIRCTTYFTREDDDQLTMNATNIPDFNYTCNWSFTRLKRINTTSEEKKEFSQPISVSLKSQIVLAVVLVVLLLVIGLIIAIIVRHKIQRKKLDGERKLGSDDELRTETRRSNDGETTGEPIETERGTLTVYENIGQECDALTTKQQAIRCKSQPNLLVHHQSIIPVTQQPAKERHSQVGTEEWIQRSLSLPNNWKKTESPRNGKTYESLANRQHFLPIDEYEHLHFDHEIRSTK